VQGHDAVESLVAGLQTADSIEDADVILLVRGGGSRTDLLAFDAEEVATAIAKCRRPVFTGIGHETDTSVADEVACRAFKTPTACAAHVVELTRGFIDATETTWSNIATLGMSVLQRAEHDLVLAGERIRQRPRDVIRTAEQHLTHTAARLRLLDPVNTMKRGWSIVRDEKGVVVRSVMGIAKGSMLAVSMFDGSVSAEVTEVKKSVGGRGA
jgi:exodeoxyribonuclease VII large subunit